MGQATIEWHLRNSGIQIRDGSQVSSPEALAAKNLALQNAANARNKHSTTIKTHWEGPAQPHELPVDHPEYRPLAPERGDDTWFDHHEQEFEELQQGLQVIQQPEDDDLNTSRSIPKDVGLNQHTEETLLMEEKRQPEVHEAFFGEQVYRSNSVPELERESAILLRQQIKKDGGIFGPAPVLTVDPIQVGLQPNEVQRTSLADKVGLTTVLDQFNDSLGLNAGAQSETGLPVVSKKSPAPILPLGSPPMIQLGGDLGVVQDPELEADPLILSQPTLNLPPGAIGKISQVPKFEFRTALDGRQSLDSQQTLPKGAGGAPALKVTSPVMKSSLENYSFDELQLLEAKVRGLLEDKIGGPLPQPSVSKGLTSTDPLSSSVAPSTEKDRQSTGHHHHHHHHKERKTSPKTLARDTVLKTSKILLQEALLTGKEEDKKHVLSLLLGTLRMNRPSNQLQQPEKTKQAAVEAKVAPGPETPPQEASPGTGTEGPVPN